MSTTLLDFGPSSESARGKRRSLHAAPSLPTLADSSAARNTDPSATVQIVTPYTILIDTREQAPYSFTGIKTDAGRPLAVVTQRECLGNGWGDYSIRGMEPAYFKCRFGAPKPGEKHPYPLISIERKSMEDAHSTFLGWGQHRDNFELELSQLNKLEFGAVVVECSEADLIEHAPEWGQKTRAENAKALSRSVDSWRIQFNRVQWVFAADRRMAEKKTFRLLEKFWKENHAR